MDTVTTEPGMPASTTTMAAPKHYVEMDKHGVMRVAGQPRMGIDSIVYAYRRRKSPGYIQRSDMFLTLEQVYGVIAYHLANLANLDAVGAYLRHQEERAERFRAEWEAAHPPPPVVQRLRALIQAHGVAREAYEAIRRQRAEAAERPGEAERP